MSASSELNIRKAHKEDIETLNYWNSLPHIIRCCYYPDALGNLPKDPDTSFEEDFKFIDTYGRDVWDIRIAEVNKKPIGVLELIDPFKEPTGYWRNINFDLEVNSRALDIWIGETRYLNKGYGTSMMEWVFKHCFVDLDCDSIVIDPLINNKDAIRFYQRLGFKKIGIEKFDNDICLVHALKRKDWLRNSSN